MDVVYVNRDGENPELRYSLRTLKNVNHDKVWIFGGVPSWVDLEAVSYRGRVQKASPYASTRAHIKAACDTPEVSDPFMLWNDDFYAMEHVGDVPVMHRGMMDTLVDQFSGAARTPWMKGLFEAHAMMEKRGLPAPLSYDLHVPLLIYKKFMREALRFAETAKSDAIHLRTLYGNLAELGGYEIADPKLVRRKDPFPPGPWLSSGDDTFRPTVEPVLRYLFPDPSKYEKGTE